MSGRYGDKTRSGEPVGNAGQRQTGGAGGTWVMTETVFNAPGTWTCPPTVTSVEVIVVGGGGGGGAFNNGPPSATPGGGGGGGGVRTAIVPVSGPVPVTVGAGGAGGTITPGTSAQVGGTSAFGPLGPGPVPLIPAPTIAAGGGGGGASTIPTETSLPAVPPIGGGGGGIGISNGYPVPNTVGTAGGRYGYRSASSTINSPQRIQTIGAGGAGDTNQGQLGGRGKLGFGFGAPSNNLVSVAPPLGGFPARHVSTPVGVAAATAGGANTGNGGGAGSWFPTPAYPIPVQPTVPLGYNGAAGGSGVVIVRHWSA